MVLLVDDTIEQLDLRRMILERKGFAVATAENAPEALEHCGGGGQGECEAVVMDLRLPKLSDGLALIRNLQTQAPGVPIIVLAGLPEELDGRPELGMVYRLLRKGTPTSVLIDLLHLLGIPSNP